MNLYEQLLSYSDSDFCPMHMPGHKRNPAFSMIDPYKIDITEIDGFDDLSHAEDVLLTLMKEAAALYGAKHSFLSVNGSTLGILAGIHACTNRGDTILIARNSHQSVYHAAFLCGLRTEYILPEIMEENICCGFSLEPIKQAIEKSPKIRLVVLPSPTYEGLHADLPAISHYLHEKNILLFIDQAHGAHLDFHPYFPGGATASGADLVVMSLHKTLPALTQTALLHICSEKIDTEKLAFSINLYQTSSPSYVLLASISQCLSYLKSNPFSKFDLLARALTLFTDRLSSFSCIRLLSLPVADKDPSKLVLSARSAGMNGRELYRILLQRFHIQPELCTADYVLCMVTLGDSESSLDRLYNALYEIDCELIQTQGSKNQDQFRASDSFITVPDRAFFPFETDELPKEWIPLLSSCNRISAGFVTIYPPGIPCLVPGERISSSLIEQLSVSKTLGLTIKGLRNEGSLLLQVLKN